MNEHQEKNVAPDEQRFFSIGCVDCGGIIMGRPRNINDGPEVIPVFASEALAALAIRTMPNRTHPPKVIEISVRII